MASLVKATGTHSTFAPGVMSGIVQRTVLRWVRVSMVLPQGEASVLFSGLLPQRNNMSPAKGVNGEWEGAVRGE